MLHLHIVCASSVALPLVLLGLLDVVAVVLPLLILLRNNVLGGLYVVFACYCPVRACDMRI